MRHANIPIFIPHLGCPYRCVYCNQNVITNTSAAPTEAEVRETIETNLKTLKNRENVEIAFFGGSFTCIPWEMQEMYLNTAKEYVDRYGLKGIRFSTRPDAVNSDILSPLKSYPISAIELGIQSFDTRVLQASGRGHGVIEIMRGVNAVKRFGVPVGLQMMIGLPEDNYDRAVYTAEKIVSMSPQFVRIYPTLVLKDTPLYELYKRGEYIPWELDEMVEVTGRVARIFMNASIPIIRMGLYSNDPRFGENIVAGPNHPAFRELVYSKLFQNRIESVLNQNRNILHIICSPQDVSLIIGQHRQNEIYFKERYGIRSVRIEVDPSLERNSFIYQGKKHTL
ncbi:elongator complex protein 3 [Guggenheimella bovis]